METRTNYVVVGGVILVLVFGLIAFVIWVVRGDIETERDSYHVYFTGSVSGLSKVSEVRYRGVPIGSVTDIRIDPENVERVRVTIAVAGGTPIKEDSVASVEPQGITGVSFVQISGGTQESPQLKAKRGEKFPVIQSKPGQLEALFADAPELVNRIMVLVAQVSELFDEKNRQAIAGTLDNLETLTATLVDKSDQIGQFMDNASAAAVELRAASSEINGLTQELRGDLDHLSQSADETLITARGALNTIGDETASLGGDVRLLVTDLRGTAASMTATSDEIRAMITENRQPLNDFSAEGLYEFARLINEMRTLVASLSRIAEQVEADPSGFLFGDRRQGFEAQ